RVKMDALLLPFHELLYQGRRRVLILPGPALPAAAAELLSQRFVQGVVAQLLRALGVPLGEAPAPRAVLAEARVQELENLVLHSPHTVVIDKLDLFQLKQAGKQCARLGE